MESFLNLLNNSKGIIESQVKIIDDLDCDEIASSKINEAVMLISELDKFDWSDNIKVGIYNLLESVLSGLEMAVPQDTLQEASMFDEFIKQEENKQSLIKNYQDILPDFNSWLERLDFNWTFFKLVDFLSSHVVAVGSNGSGKTSLYNQFIKCIDSGTGVFIPAQRVLYISNFTSFEEPNAANRKLRKTQFEDKTNKDNSRRIRTDEFDIVLKSLVAQNNSISYQYRTGAIQRKKNMQEYEDPEETNLDKTIEIWNSFITHRKLICDNGINISVKSDSTLYNLASMSDGEKNLLYLTAQVLQAPTNGLIIIDEPEIYLHRAIRDKVWNVLEKERLDCLFIYLTHDLDFATSRKTARKIWIKSFEYPDKWDIQNIPENEIPESLFLEVLGSKKNVLFCEGTRDSNDYAIYSILFPDFTVVPVGACSSVITYTKSLNSIDSLHINAFGLIDSDHSLDDREVILNQDSIYILKVSEIESLLLLEEFLKVFAKSIHSETSIVDEIKEKVLSKLEEDKEQQSSNYVSAKIDFYFKESNLPKANTVGGLKTNFTQFTDQVYIQDWYDSRLVEINTIIVNNNYDEAIRIYNNKGLLSIASLQFGLKSKEVFIQKSIKFLQESDTAREVLLSKFPRELA